MTNVLDLTSAASADYTFATSALLAAEADGFKAVGLDEMTNLAGLDIGAMLTRDGSANSHPAASWTALRFGGVAWDTGSWSDSNSVGLLRVPNDKWQFVEIGMTTANGVTNDGAMRIVTIAGTANGSIHYPYLTYNYDSTTFFHGSIHSIVEVSSGDVFQAQVFITGGGTETTSRTDGGFWIRGYSARG